MVSAQSTPAATARPVGLTGWTEWGAIAGIALAC